MLVVSIGVPYFSFRILSLSSMPSAFRIFIFIYYFTALTFVITACKQQPTAPENTKLEDVAGSEEALNFMKTFEGRGLLADSSVSTSPGESLKRFRYPDDLAFDIVLSEPEVTQPVFINFDHRGRLWVVQYNQYPYPKGIKVLNMDQYIRAQYDKMPQPPPEGQKGADKISFFEDTDGDGTFDKATDAITGLNIATSVVLGRGKIWVMDPPYLLAYTDADNDGVPEGNPEVCLEGFGIEDTHAVANNLRWGPDGWLYGAQGSTCTANVSSAVSKNVAFNGQAIWRYHPEKRIFEVFAEGGGNTFDVEIDDKGRLFSGDNGTTHGRYYKQGAYHVRNLGKHGSFTNPYALGNLADMEHSGENIRFTHAFVRYQEQNLPSQYHDRMIALNPLQNFVLLSSFEPKGSTFSNHDAERIVQTDDHWFRPVDIITGPDGAIYVADWYDSRMSHIDPRDNWSKSTGRVYRLRNKNLKPGITRFDISKYTDDSLIQLLTNKNRWLRQQAMIEVGNRKDSTLLPVLYRMLNAESGQTALEAFWAIALSGGFNDRVATQGMTHRDPFVRMWAVRLTGDENKLSPGVFNTLMALTSKETHPEVRSQLAATAKRLPGISAVPLIRNLLKNGDDSNDPDIPMQIWWALESKAGSDRAAIIEMFKDVSIWSNPTVRKTILPRLMQRWVMEGGSQNYEACAKLLMLAPTQQEAEPLISGLEEGLRGRDVVELSGELVTALRRFQTSNGIESLTLQLRQGQQKAIGKALQIMSDDNAALGERLAYIRIFGEINKPEAVPVLLKLMDAGRTSGAIKQASIKALERYGDPEIGKRVTDAYPDRLRADPDVRNAALSLLALRKSWALQLLDAIDKKKKEGEKFVAHRIDKEDIPLRIANQLLLLQDETITGIVTRLWPAVTAATTGQKSLLINKVSEILKSGMGDPVKGKVVFNSRCGNCHRLFGEGADIGPDLTGYDRKNINEIVVNVIDPNAYIREGYGAYHITTADKRSILGTLKSKNGSTISIQQFNGEVTTLSMDQVNEIVEQKTSIMPEGLLNGLSDQAIRDLLAYLSKDLQK